MKMGRFTLSWHWVLCIVPLFFLLRSYLLPGVPFTHDGENHLARFANYKIAIREGQFPPRFAPNLMNHYGYPVFNYNYPLLNILSLPLSVAGISYEVTFKVLAAVGVGIGMWGVLAWLKECGFRRLSRFFAAGVFVVSPFLANLILVRGSIGEIWALGLFPWLLWYSKRIKHQKAIPLFMSVALITAFFLSHNISVLFGGVLWGVYSLAKFRAQWSLWKTWLFPVILAGLMSVWFWLPALAEKSLVVLDGADVSSQYSRHFVQLAQLFTSPLQFGYSFAVPVDTMSFSLGLTAAVSLVLMTLWLVKRKPASARQQAAWLWFFVLVCWLLLFLQTSLSAGVWKILPLVAFIQFPWRLMLFVSVLVLPLIAAAMQLGRGVRRVLWLCIVAQLIALGRLWPVDFVHKSTVEYDLFAQSTSTLNENRVKGFTYLLIGDWRPQPTVLSGEATVTVEHWTGSSRRYHVTAVTDVLIVEPTMVFAGWETRVNGQVVPYVTADETEGRLGYRLGPGEYEVTSRFTQKTWPRLVGNSISAITLVIWGWCVWQERKQLSGK